MSRVYGPTYRIFRGRTCVAGRREPYLSYTDAHAAAKLMQRQSADCGWPVETLLIVREGEVVAEVRP